VTERKPGWDENGKERYQSPGPGQSTASIPGQLQLPLVTERGAETEIKQKKLARSTGKRISDQVQHFARKECVL
jgi:hypothetical protein